MVALVGDFHFFRFEAKDRRSADEVLKLGTPLTSLNCFPFSKCECFLLGVQDSRPAQLPPLLKHASDNYVQVTAHLLHAEKSFPSKLVHSYRFEYFLCVCVHGHTLVLDTADICSQVSILFI